MTMPQTATHPGSYEFNIPRIVTAEHVSETVLLKQIDKLRKNVSKHNPWGGLMNNLNALGRLTGKSFNLNVSSVTEIEQQQNVDPVLQAISSLTNWFCGWALEEQNPSHSRPTAPSVHPLLRRDIHREVCFCSKASAMSRLLLLFVRGDMVHEYIHRTRIPRQEEGTGGVQSIADGEKYLRLRPSNYESMAACSALQHAITHNKDTRGLQIEWNNTTPTTNLEALVDAGKAMDQAAKDFLGAFVVKREPK